MKITDDIILQINRIYKEVGTYAETARRVGCSAGTVKKYIITDFDEAAVVNVKTFTSDKIPTITNIDHIKDLENICDLCCGLEHLNKVVEIRKEILL